MYIKRILIAVALIGLIALGGFSFFVYNAVFSPNTAFENEDATIFIPSGATFDDVKKELRPLLSDMLSFEQIAQKKDIQPMLNPENIFLKKEVTITTLSIRSAVKTHLSE